MADSQAAEKLYTLTEVAQKTKISMPTLQRYKKLYQARIPSRGQGRSQRYPEDALDVFRQLKKENISRRGRPRKNASAARGRPAGRGHRPAVMAVAKPAEDLLTLTQIGQMTGISYPTLLRYSKNNISKIPHKGTGRARRYHPEAVAVFKDLRSKSKRGRKAGKPTAAEAVAARSTGTGRRGRPPKPVDSGDLLTRVTELEKVNKKLVRNLGKIEKKLDKIRIVMR